MAAAGASGVPPRRRLRTNVMLASAALAVLVSGILVALVTLIVHERSAEATHQSSDRIIAQANVVQKLTLDLETGERGFVITRQPRFLEPWSRARSAYRREIAMLLALGRDTDNASSRKGVRSLAAAAASYHTEVSEPLVAAARRNPRSARASVRSGEGKRRVDRIRALVDDLIAAEGQRSQQAADRASATREDAIVTGAVGAVLALAVIAMFALYVLRGIVRPVGSVAEAADRLAGGDLAPRVPIAGPHELAQLAESFNHMACTLERDRGERAQAEQALRDGEARLQAILDNSTAVIYVKDLGGRYMLVNRRLKELLGVNGQDVTGWAPHELLGPGVDDLEANDRRVIDEGEAIAAEEVVPVHGEDRTYLSIKFPLRDPASGSIYAIGGMSTDITDRKRAEQVAEAAKREAEAANEAKSRFLSRMSHELRTPLNAILGFGQVLELDELGEAQAESVEQIMKGGRHLLQLIDEVLEISRIEAGELSISPEPVDVHYAVTEVLDLMSPLAAERGVRMDMTSQDGIKVYARADYQRLRQVLLNLVSNGIKYNRPGGGSLSLSIVRSPEARVRIVVADAGLGIAPDELPRLFTPFDRLSANTEDIEGTGLGLALSKRLVEAMEGTIAVESEVGAGTTFTVELAAANVQLERHDDGVLAPRKRSPSARDGRRTVLCIEDNVSNVKLLKHVFRGVPKVDLLAAGQGSLGIELARQHRPDLILLDLNLPDVSGQQVLRDLQSHEATRTSPVVVLSADATDRQVERLLALGAREYLTKPFDVRRLLEVVGQVLSGRAT
jgi:PAS domain S-box-containing protein